MPLTARAYLLDRFRADAAALRLRAESLGSRETRRSAPTPGPDASTSARMADACDAVVAMIEAVAESMDATRMLADLGALAPLLTQRAALEANAPAVRAVYLGAATRIREVEAAELRAVPAASERDGRDDDQSDGDEPHDIDDATDEDLSDDDVYPERRA